MTLSNIIMLFGLGFLLNMAMSLASIAGDLSRLANLAERQAKSAEPPQPTPAVAVQPTTA
ncbi:MAG: hypothetical protein WAX89_05105 [Alphaproteobacteria bacterium]